MYCLLVADDPTDRLSSGEAVRQAFPRARVVEVDGPARFEDALQTGGVDFALVVESTRWQGPVEVLRRIAAQCPGCPVLMLGTESRPEATIAAIANGFDDYLLTSEAGSQRFGLAIQAALARAARHVRQAFQLVPASLCHCSVDGSFVHVNERFREMLAMSADADLGGQRLAMYLQDPAALDRIIGAAQTPSGAEILLRRQDGTDCWALMWAHRIGTGQGSEHFACAFTDITDRKRADDRTGALLREKNILLEELYHRVNNNLQIVMSFVHQLVRETTDPAARANLQDLSSRIQSLALVQDQLYRNQNFVEADLGQYLEELCAARLRGSDIVFATELVDLRLPIGHAIPIGLIANELLINAVQHAFAGVSHPRVRVVLHRVDLNRAKLVVEDNGVGLKGQPAPRGHGYRLIELLARQVGADISLASSEGTAVEIAFPVPS